MKKILIIDDDIEFVDAVKILLESNGYDVNTANNTENGLNSINRDKPDLVILDVMMDSPDEGFQFAYKLKNDDKLKNIPILMSTSVSQVTGMDFSPASDNRNEEWISVDEFIEKPIESEKFLAVVEKLLNK